MLLRELCAMDLVLFLLGVCELTELPVTAEASDSTAAFAKYCAASVISPSISPEA